MKSEMRKRASPSNTFQEESRENNAVGAPSCGYHTRGTGPILREDKNGRERREQYIELGVNFIEQEHST